MFTDRQEAGKLLGRLVVAQLAAGGGSERAAAIVVGLPRGGVAVAKPVSLALQAPLTILVSKKIGAPFQPELALGAVSSRGTVVLDQTYAAGNPEYQSYIAQQSEQLKQSTKLKEDEWLKQAHLTAASFAGKRVVVVDDGVATGMTTLAALRGIAREAPLKLILAVPVIARQTAYRLQAECHHIIALQAPSDLQAVGLYYEDFHQVEDSELLADLIEANHDYRSHRAS